MINVFSLLSTPTLLPLISVSGRFSALILRLFKSRLLQATNLDEYILLLECFPPSAKLTEPPSFCTYLGTNGLDTVAEPDLPQGRGDGSGADIANELKRLSSLNSRFRPNLHKPEYNVRRRHPAGDIPGSRTWDETLASSSKAIEVGEDTVTQKVSLEAGETLTQLCAVTNLVKLEPRRGMISDRVELSEGIVRIWRDWLSKRSREYRAQDGNDTGSHPLEGEQFLWANDGQNVGIKLRVRQRKWRDGQPILFSSEEELAVGYTIEYEGKLSPSSITSHLDLINFQQSCWCEHLICCLSWRNLETDKFLVLARRLCLDQFVLPKTISDRCGQTLLA